MTPRALVCVIDDDDAVRDSLSFLLGTAGFSVRAYASAPDFLAQAADLQPHCILTDVRMAPMNGLELLRALRAGGSRVPVIVMTGHADVPLAVEAMKSGAADFIEKPFHDEALLAALAAAIRQAEQSGQRQTESSLINGRIAELSARERQVLAGLLAGKANKVIAHELGISPRTVEVYRANVMTKMEAGSLSELVRMALLAGFDGAAG